MTEKTVANPHKNRRNDSIPANIGSVEEKSKNYNEYLLAIQTADDILATVITGI